jgi:hypothetical protein
LRTSRPVWSTTSTSRPRRRLTPSGRSARPGTQIAAPRETWDTIPPCTESGSSTRACPARPRPVFWA